MNQQHYIPYREIPAELNIRKGDIVLVTSDILKLAIKARRNEKEFSLDTLIDSFKESIGPEGTLLIPSYNFDLESGDSFGVEITEPMTGSLAVTAMKRDDFLRTKNPLHSFLVTGKDAGMLAEMDNESSFGADSPFAYLHSENAKMLFLGTSPAEAMTFTHYVEETVKVRYRRYRNVRINYTGEDQITTRRKYYLYAKKHGWTMHMEGIERSLLKEVLDINMINDVPCYSIRARDAFDAISEDIRTNKAGSISHFSSKLLIRDIIKGNLKRFNLFRTTHGKIRSGKRIP